MQLTQKGSHRIAVVREMICPAGGRSRCEQFAAGQKDVPQPQPRTESSATLPILFGKMRIDQLRYLCQVMVIVLGNKIQMNPRAAWGCLRRGCRLVRAKNVRFQMFPRCSTKRSRAVRISARISANSWVLWLASWVLAITQVCDGECVSVGKEVHPHAPSIEVRDRASGLPCSLG